MLILKLIFFVAIQGVVTSWNGFWNMSRNDADEQVALTMPEKVAAMIWCESNEMLQY